jgi:hypothetical protein
MDVDVDFYYTDEYSLFQHRCVMRDAGMDLAALVPSSFTILAW